MVTNTNRTEKPMAKNKTSRRLTTVQITIETNEKLKLISKSHARSNPQQVTKMIEQEYDWLRSIKLIPSVEEVIAEKAQAE